METTKVVDDGKIGNTELGIMMRRLMEIVRRINEGTIEKHDAMKALQMIVEGRSQEITKIPEQVKRFPFKMLPVSERRKSRAPLKMRPQQWRDRLFYKYRQFFRKQRAYDGKVLMPEDIIAYIWEAENIPKLWVNHGSTPVNAILGTEKPSVHDREIVAATLQWLGTNVGRSFLDRLIKTAELHL